MDELTEGNGERAKKHGLNFSAVSLVVTCILDRNFKNGPCISEHGSKSREKYIYKHPKKSTFIFPSVSLHIYYGTTVWYSGQNCRKHFLVLFAALNLLSLYSLSCVILAMPIWLWSTCRKLSLLASRSSGRGNKRLPCNVYDLCQN